MLLSAQGVKPEFRMGPGPGDRGLGWQMTPVPERSLLGRHRCVADSGPTRRSEREGTPLRAVAVSLCQANWPVRASAACQCSLDGVPSFFHGTR